jgi:hypothetical protein
MTTTTKYHQWETVSDRVSQSLALAKVLRKLFWQWEDEHKLGTTFEMHGLDPMDLRLVTDLLTGGLNQAEELLGHMEPIDEVHP